MAEVVQFDLGGVPLRPFEGGEMPDDLFDGGVAQDTMEGGPGGDTYIPEDLGDRVREAMGEGIDRIEATVDVSLREVEVEVIALLGDDRIDAYGGPRANEIIGNARVKVLAGLGRPGGFVEIAILKGGPRIGIDDVRLF